MRSRYSAYCAGHIDYLVSTTLPKQQPMLDQKGMRDWSAQAEWCGLDVIECTDGLASDDIGYVRFIASYKQAGKQHDHQEHSRFQKIDGRWYYDDGMPTPVETFKRDTPKVGRNDPCPCGSGKKYKKCCG